MRETTIKRPIKPRCRKCGGSYNPCMMVDGELWDIFYDDETNQWVGLDNWCEKHQIEDKEVSCLKCEGI